MPDQLHFTDSADANSLLVSDPMALLIGFVLDQQVTVQKAFSGPKDLRERLGHLDPGRIAAMPPDELEAVFRAKPAIHRYPGSMAGRVQALCDVISDRYSGDGSRVWTEAADAKDLVARLGALPGIGDMKVRSLVATLVKQYGVRPPGWESVMPNHPTLGDVTTPEELEAYQAAKRAHKQKVRAEKARKELA